MGWLESQGYVCKEKFVRYDKDLGSNMTVRSARDELALAPVAPGVFAIA